MKNLKIAISILVILIAVISISHIYLYGSSERMADQISSAEKNVISGKTDNALKNIENFEGEWERNKHVFATFIRHAEIDLANQSAAKLSTFLKEDDKTDFLAECETLRMQINHIAETEQFNLDNIF